MSNRIRFALSALILLAGWDAGAQVIIHSPANGATVPSPVPLSASLATAQLSRMTVSDNGKQVARKEGVSSLEIPLKLGPGSHTISVTAEEKFGRTTTAVTTINVGAAVSSIRDVGAEFAGDMAGKNEGLPYGVPLSYEWATHPATVMGNNPTGWRAITAWGVVYIASQGNPAVNARVNIRDMRTYWFRKSTKKWVPLQKTDAPEGAAYAADFDANRNAAADLRREPDGTISVTAGPGYNFHFYPAGRASIDPNDVGGILTVFQARLIVADPTRPDDRDAANYLAGAGADYYPALTGKWPGNLPYNPGIALGKEKYVKKHWRFFAMTTMTEAEMRKYPPPLELIGVER